MRAIEFSPPNPAFGLRLVSLLLFLSWHDEKGGDSGVCGEEIYARQRAWKRNKGRGDGSTPDMT